MIDRESEFIRTALEASLKAARAEIKRLRSELAETKLRYEAECEDHEASLRAMEAFYSGD